MYFVQHFSIFIHGEHIIKLEEKPEICIFLYEGILLSRL